MPDRKMKPTMFRIPQQQLDWLAAESQKTGLSKVEILRRALDDYKDVQAEKERRNYFTPEQRENIREISRMRGVSEVQVVRQAVDKESKFLSKLRQHKKER